MMPRARRPIAALLLAACATSPAATACELPRNHVRTPAEAAYDAEFVRWSEEAAQRLRNDADPDIAWAVFTLTAYDAPRTEDFPQRPVAPATRVGRVLRATHCGVSNRCPADYAEWVTLEPGNAFVRALERRTHDERIEREATAALRQATRYDDGFLSLVALRDRLAASTGDPPPPPATYRQWPCPSLHSRELAARFDELIKVFVLNVPDDFTSNKPPDNFVHDETLDEAAKLRFADILVAATGTPIAAAAGAKLGLQIAPTRELRERYCRLYEHARQQREAAPLEWLMFSRDAETSGVRQRFLDALATRNGIDAVDAIVPHLPLNRQPHSADDEWITRCIGNKSVLDDETRSDS